MKHISQVFHELGIPVRAVPKAYRAQIVHVVPVSDAANNRLVALCGKDTTHMPTQAGEPTCVVCLDLEGFQ